MCEERRFKSRDVRVRFHIQWDTRCLLRKLFEIGISARSFWFLRFLTYVNFCRLGEAFQKLRGRAHAKMVGIVNIVNITILFISYRYG